jgi:hypothetical protein
VHLRYDLPKNLMRIFHILPIFSLLFVASASSLDSRRADAHPLDARDASDVCALIDQPLWVTSLDDGLFYYVGPLGQFDNPPLNRFRASLL